MSQLLTSDQIFSLPRIIFEEIYRFFTCLNIYCLSTYFFLILINLFSIYMTRRVIPDDIFLLVLLFMVSYFVQFQTRTEHENMRNDGLENIWPKFYSQVSCSLYLVIFLNKLTSHTFFTYLNIYWRCFQLQVRCSL